MKKPILSLVCLLCLVFGCKHQEAMTAEDQLFYCLPGECAVFKMWPSVVHSKNEGKSYFKLNWTFLFDKAIGEKMTDRTLYSYVWPTEDVFDEFGERKEQVKDDYQSLVRGMFEAKENKEIDECFCTVFQRSALTISSNLPVGGIQPGEDLSSLCKDLPSYLSDLDNLTLSVSNPQSLYNELRAIPDFSLGDMGVFLPALEKQDQVITFTVSIPVRRVYLLHWLDGLSDNPDAPMPFSDEVLVATVSLGPYYITDNGGVHFY